jgi:flagellar biosynthesis protein FlhG
MITDQASRLRRLMFGGSSPSGEGSSPQLLVVAGAKGGVGTTTIAVNLAVALALDGRRTVLVDADLGRADAGALCGAPDGNTVADVLAGRLSVHEALVRGPAGILVLPGAWATGHVSECAPAAQERLLHELARLGPHAEFVVLDAGNGQHRAARRFWQAAQRVLFVTSCDETAVMNTYAAIKLLAAEGARPQVQMLVNLTVDSAKASDTQTRLRRAGRRFLGLALVDAGQVPCDDRVAAAGRQRTSFLLESPECAAARPLETLAENLAGAPAESKGGRRIASRSTQN